AEKVVARSVEISNPAGAETAQYLSVPYYRVLRKLGEHDAAGLEAALTNALALHKEYWSATEDRRKEKAGFVSLPLIALAALAWDRGLRFHVESDYLPWSWVTGEIFTPRFADASK
ncbi:MAG: immunity 49 family protein, partial [Planctomycetes bacterium]|nr:immunity 49 family protein [Planctomycetota bacterium]